MILLFQLLFIALLMLGCALGAVVTGLKFEKRQRGVVLRTECMDVCLCCISCLSPCEILPRDGKKKKITFFP